MQKLGKLFLQGMLAVLPIGLTIYLLYWMAASAESVLGGGIRFVLRRTGAGESYYVTGMGVAIACLLILAIGILLQMWLFRSLLARGERLLEKIPGIMARFVTWRVFSIHPNKRTSIKRSWSPFWTRTSV